jgi:hypothetical protein
MIVGFDYFKTLTTHHKEFRPVARAILDAGGKVYVISALSDQANREQYEKSLEKFLKDTNFPYSDFFVVVFPKGKEEDNIPYLKLEKCQDLGVEIYIDDREDVVELMAQNGIVGLKIMNYFEKTGGE